MLHASRLSAGVLLAGSALMAQVNVLTYHNDNSRTGLNNSETQLTPSSVRANFHRLPNLVPADPNESMGYVHAQPLFMSNLTVNGVYHSGVVFVATELDRVYAFDATTGAQLWDKYLVTNGGAPYPEPNVAPQQCATLGGMMGITGTPVIDPATNRLYAVAAALENGGGLAFRLWGIDITTGAFTLQGQYIQGQAPGDGDGGTAVVFNSFHQLQRAGLVLASNRLYVPFTGYCEDESTGFTPRHGFIMAYDTGTFAPVATYVTTPTGAYQQGGIWGGGAAPAADSIGRIWFATGNGANNNSANNCPFTVWGSYCSFGDSYVKLEPPGNDQWVTGDFFTPSNEPALNSGDLDLGSGGTIILPDSVGNSAHQHLMIGAGKEGKVYLVDSYNMGHYQSSGDPNNLAGNNLSLNAEVFGVPAYFNNDVYFAPGGTYVNIVHISNATASGPTSISDGVTNFSPFVTGGVPSISANNNTNGILWVVYGGDEGQPSTLKAYDLNDHSTLATITDLGGHPHFAVPTIANGSVFIGSVNAVAVYTVN